LQGRVIDVGQNASQTAVDASTVHVAALGRDVDAGLYTGVEPLLCQCHEGLLNRLVCDGRGVVHALQLCGHLCEQWVGRVLQVVVVQQTRVGLGDELASGGVEGHVVEAVDGSFLLRAVAIDAVAVLLRLQRLLARIVRLVAGIHSFGVAANGEVAVDDGILAREIGLVEVVCVPDVGSTLTGLNGKRRIRANKHSHAASTASWARIAFLVQRNVASHHNRVAAVPGGGLDPVDAVEQRVGAAVACIDRVHALDVVVAAFVKQLHQDRLDRLRLVEQRLGADLEAANGFGVDAVLLEQRGERSQGERVDVYIG